jgi:hypothetical protein
MILPGDNPYQAPQTANPGELPPAPSPFGWHLEGKTVWTETGAQFPMVDPFSGQCGDTMMLQKVNVYYRPWKLRWLMPAGVVLGILIASPGWSLSEWILPGLIGLFFGWIACGIGGVFFPKCELLLFFEKRTLRNRKILGTVMTLLFLLFLPGSFFFQLGPAWLHVIPGVAGACWLVGTLALFIFQRKLRCPSKRGEQFGVKGFHPKALAAMAAAS